MSLLRPTRLRPHLRSLRSFCTAGYQISQFGEASTVLSRQSLTTPKSAIGNKLVVKWLAAGVDPVDLASVRGHPDAASFAPLDVPGVPGTEGVGVVEHAGPDVVSIKSGDFVIPIKTSLGTWCESGIVNEYDVIRVPNAMRLELAATLSTSPFTALRLLSDFGSLSSGDVVVLNNASSAVGTALIQIANSLNLKTICFVDESSADYAPTVERLKLMGGDVVVGESYAASGGLDMVLSDMPKAKLGLNGAGAESCSLVASMVEKGGSVVTYFPGVSNDQAVKGMGATPASFDLPAWLERSDRKVVEGMVGQLTNMIDEGKLTAWLQRVKFDDLPAAIQTGGMTKRKLVAMMPATETL